jgi:hypothetical protein
MIQDLGYHVLQMEDPQIDRPEVFQQLEADDGTSQPMLPHVALQGCSVVAWLAGCLAEPSGGTACPEGTSRLATGHVGSGRPRRPSEREAYLSTGTRKGTGREPWAAARRAWRRSPIVTMGSDDPIARPERYAKG